MKKIILLLSIFFSFSFYGQNDSISDVINSNLSIVLAEKRNVVYRGLRNQISISVPNVKSFIATAPGLSKTSDGNYILMPGTGTEVFIIVVYNQKNGKSVKEKHRFKILNLPPLEVVIGKDNYSVCRECILEISKSELNNAKISFKNNRSLPYEFPFEISSMWFIFSNDKAIMNEGNIINSEVFSEIEKLNKGEIVTIKFALNTTFDVFVKPLRMIIAE